MSDSQTERAKGGALGRGLAFLGGIPSRVAWLILRLGPAGGGRAFGPLSFWFLWQCLTNRYYGTRPVRPGALLRYAVRTYKGPPVRLSDGTDVLPGDRIAELHLDNGTLAARLSTDAARGRATAWTWLATRWVAEDLATLATSGRLAPQVKALRGVSLLARGSRRLGFEVRELPRSRWNSLVRFFMLGLLTIYHPNGRRRLRQAERDAHPAEVWLGRRTLEDRYQRLAG